MVQPGGPSNHCLTSPGLVKASKTRRRGALKTRVIAISRSLGVVIFNAPVFVIRDLLYEVYASNKDAAGNLSTPKAVSSSRKPTASETQHSCHLLYRLVRARFLGLVSASLSSPSRASRRWKLPSQRRRYLSSHTSSSWSGAGRNA